MKVLCVVLALFGAFASYGFRIERTSDGHADLELPLKYTGYSFGEVVEDKELKSGMDDGLCFESHCDRMTPFEKWEVYLTPKTKRVYKFATILQEKDALSAYCKYAVCLVSWQKHFNDATKPGRDCEFIFAFTNAAGNASTAFRMVVGNKSVGVQWVCPDLLEIAEKETSVLKSPGTSWSTERAMGRLLPVMFGEDLSDRTDLETNSNGDRCCKIQTNSFEPFKEVTVCITRKTSRVHFVNGRYRAKDRADAVVQYMLIVQRCSDLFKIQPKKFDDVTKCFYFEKDGKLDSVLSIMCVGDEVGFRWDSVAYHEEADEKVQDGAEGKRDFTTVKMGEVLAFDIPDNLEVQGGSYKVLTDAVKGRYIGADVSKQLVVQQKGLNDNLPGAHEDYARIVVDFAEADPSMIKQPSDFTTAEVNAWGDAIRSAFQEGFVKQRAAGIDIKAIGIESAMPTVSKVGNRSSLFICYERQLGSAPIVQCMMYQVNLRGLTCQVMVSCRSKDRRKWMPILTSVIDSFRFAEK